MHVYNREKKWCNNSHWFLNIKKKEIFITSFKEIYGISNNHVNKIHRKNLSNIKTDTCIVIAGTVKCTFEGGGYSVVQELWVDVFKKISLYQINIDYLIIIPTLKVLEELSGVSVPYFQCVI